MDLDDIIQQLVDWWDNGKIKQGFSVVDITAGADDEILVMPIQGVADEVILPPLSTLYELALRAYIRLDESRSTQGNRIWQVFLLPKLREEILLNQEEAEVTQLQLVDSRRVFVVHGRNLFIRDSIFSFLRAIGLDPIEWSQAIAMTGSGTPYIGQVLDVAFDQAQAILVVMTPDDEVQLREELWNESESEDEKTAQYQPRPNVLFEAGMAFGRNPDRTILVEIGSVKPYSDVDGRHRIRMNDNPQSRNELVNRLRNAGCAVDIENRNDWLNTGNFNINF